MDLHSKLLLVAHTYYLALEIDSVCKEKKMDCKAVLDVLENKMYDILEKAATDLHLKLVAD